MQWHQRALDIAEQIGCGRGQGRAYGDLGLTYEALGNFERAVFYQEQHLSVAAQTNDLPAKTLAYGSLGRTHHALQNFAQAVMYLQEGREFHGVLYTGKYSVIRMLVVCVRDVHISWNRPNNVGVKGDVKESLLTLLSCPSSSILSSVFPYISSSVFSTKTLKLTPVPVPTTSNIPAKTC